MVAGTPVRVYGVCQDVDVEHRHRQDLQQMVDALTSRNRLVEDLNRMLGRNLNGPAGALRTLVSGIRGPGVLSPEVLVVLQSSTASLLDTLRRMTNLVKSTTLVERPTEPGSLEEAYLVATVTLAPLVKDAGATVEYDSSACPALCCPRL